MSENPSQRPRSYWASLRREAEAAERQIDRMTQGIEADLEATIRRALEACHLTDDEIFGNPNSGNTLQIPRRD